MASELKEESKRLVGEMRATVRAIDDGAISPDAACVLYREGYLPRLDLVLRAISQHIPSGHRHIYTESQDASHRTVKYHVHTLAMGSVHASTVREHFAGVADLLEQDIQYIP